MDPEGSQHRDNIICQARNPPFVRKDVDMEQVMFDIGDIQIFYNDLVFEHPGSVSTEDLGIIVIKRDLLDCGFGEAIVQRGLEVRG